MANEEPPMFPAGEFVPPDVGNSELRSKLIDQLADVPSRVREMVRDLDDDQLNTKYRNWTIRQIVHHLADSHINCYVRCRWTLTEPTPTIKAYDETRWSGLPDAKTIPLESSLQILDGIHARWVQLLRLLGTEELKQAFIHPETGNKVTLAEVIPAYVWHADHHLAQIDWIKTNRAW